MKLKCPELFGCPLPSNNTKVFELQAQNMLPKRDQLGRRVYIIRVGKSVSIFHKIIIMALIALVFHSVAILETP